MSADYIALYSDGPDKPVVTYSSAGVAMVYTECGQLAEAPSLIGFKAVVPTDSVRKKVWKLNGTFGIGDITEE